MQCNYCQLHRTQFLEEILETDEKEIKFLVEKYWDAKYAEIREDRRAKNAEAANGTG